MKNLKLLTLSLFLLIGLFACNKYEILDQKTPDNYKLDNGATQRSAHIESVEELPQWFESHLFKTFDSEIADVALQIFSPRYDEMIIWNDSTVVIPCNHFITTREFGYTRLFLQFDSNGTPTASFFTIIPKDQTKTNFDLSDIQSFNGKLNAYSLLDGFKEKIIYKEGVPDIYISAAEVASLRCPGCPPWWPGWASQPHDGNASGDPFTFTTPNNNQGDSGFEVLCYGEDCPRGYPKNGHPCNCTRVDCNNNSGTEPGSLIIEITINGPTNPGPAFNIHNNGTDAKKHPGGGGGNTGNNPPNSNPGSGNDPGSGTNPVDEAGLDEIHRQKVCNFADSPMNTTGLDCDDLIGMIDPSCFEAVNFNACALESLENQSTEDPPVGNQPSETEAACNQAISTFYETYNIQPTIGTTHALRNISGCGEGMSQGVFNRSAIGELIRDQGATPNQGTINFLSGEQQSLAWVLNNIENVDILNSLTDGNALMTVEERTGAAFFLHSMKNNLSTLSTDDPNLNAALEQFWPGPTIPTVGLEFGLDLALQVEQEVMFLREVHKDDPSWTNNWLYAHAIKKVFSGTTHTLLQLCGLIEGPGIVCDGIDALFYLAEGDGKNAAMSSFAMIPFLGMTAPGQRAYKAITGAAGRKIGLRFSVDAAGVVHFSYRGQLARVIGKVAGHQAHHIIPWSENFHPIVQLAARYGWHPNDFINGISVLNARHGSHPAYTAAIRAKLGEISAKVGNSGAQAVIELETLAVNVSNIIRNNTIPINDPQIINLINNIPI